MTLLWCELAWLGGSAPAPGVTIELDGELIGAVMTGIERPPPEAERLSGLIIPGLANAHSHSFQRALRGRTQRAVGSFWTWRKQMYELAAALDPDSMLALSRATFTEMALAGVTVVGEFHYVHHGPTGELYDDPNALGAAVIQAAGEVGIRLTLLDACYLDGGIDPDPIQKRFFDGDGVRWAERVDRLEDGPAVRIGAAIHSLRAVPPGPAALVAAHAHERSWVLHAHVSEQPAENEACQKSYRATPTGLLDSVGALSEEFTAVHATHLTDADVALLGGASACCCLCPTTERDLADGIGPARRLRDAGCSLSIGTDSNALIEPFEEARAIELDERLASRVRGGLDGSELLGAATASGYACLGWPEGGVIRPGALADLVAVRTDGIRLAGLPAADAVDGLVFAGAAADVRDVVVGGRFIVRDGAHVTLDAVSELERAVRGVAP